MTGGPERPQVARVQEGVEFQSPQRLQLMPCVHPTTHTIYILRDAYTPQTELTHLLSCGEAHFSYLKISEDGTMSLSFTPGHPASP